MIYLFKTKKLKNKCVHKILNETIIFPTFPTRVNILILNILNIKIMLESLWNCWKTLEVVKLLQHFPTEKDHKTTLTYCKSVL